MRATFARCNRRAQAASVGWLSLSEAAPLVPPKWSWLEQCHLISGSAAALNHVAKGVLSCMLQDNTLQERVIMHFVLKRLLGTQ